MKRRHLLQAMTAMGLFSFFKPTLASECPAQLSSDSLRQLNSEQPLNLCEITQGKVSLFVNVASHCGFTYQYEGLERLYKRYADKGLVVIGFPSSDFFQEKDKEADIAQFCQLNYGVTFPMSQKIHVRGDNAHPLFKWLQQSTGTSVKWNFYKYLVDKNGTPVKAYSSMTEPEDEKLIKDIEALL